MMRLTLVVSLAAALLVTASAPAAAQTAPPTSERTDDLSQINGVPVKVGEHNEYHYGFKRTNVAVNPIGLMMGMYGMSLAHGFHPNLALRVEATLMKPIDAGDATGYELDVGLPIYLRRTYQGPFVELGLMVREMTVSDGYSEREAGPQALLGWHWLWDSGLNLAVAFGVGRNLAADDTDEYGDSELFANGYLKVGLAF